MTPARLQTVEEIFHAALDQEPDQVGAFLDAACEGDEVLRRKVEALVASHQRAGSFIETTVAGITTRIIENEQADLLVGRTIGHYKISKRIGTGGMGDVYLATDMTAGRKAALKLLPMRFTGDAERLKRFQQEAHAVVGLNHPNILTVYEIGEDHSIHYIASELIEGETLRQRLMRGRIEVGEAVDVAIQVASALAAAHETGIVHRDIKPENIMLRPDGYVKVLDFGIAKLAESTFAEATADEAESVTLAETNLGSILGTVRYMSPEQARGAQVDKRTDVWSLGVVLYEMVTGHAPFTGETPGEAMTSILEKEPPALTSYITHTPAELQQIISRTLRKERAERYQSAHELLEALQSLRRSMEFKTALERSTKAPSWLRWTAMTAALLALAAIVAGIVMFSRNRVRSTLVVPEKSIAVLPFENLSRDPDSAYFADGVQEEILTRLASIANLKVISRTSTQRYQSKPRNLAEIAKQLGVANILEGSVQKADDQVRVNAQLINAQTDSHLWADTYDRKLTDVFEVESDIAKGIAESLRAKLTGREEQALAVKPTNNPEAYDAYLRGLSFEARSHAPSWFTSPDLILKAIGFYERTVQLDANFALVWARLSRMNSFLYFNPVDPTTATRREAAKRALDNAQKLEANSPETLLALGYYQYWVLRDYGRAKTTFGRVSKMLPSSSEVSRALALIARREGQWDESIAQFEHALGLDPRNVELLITAAETYGMRRQFPAALKLYDRALDITPNDPDVMAAKGSIYQAQGDLPEAARLLSQINEHTPAEETFHIKITQARLERNYGECVRLLQAREAEFASKSQYEKALNPVWLAFMQRVAGNTAGAKITAERARNTLEPLYRHQPDNFVFAASLSQIYAAMGQKQSALKAAEESIVLLPSSKDRVSGPSLEQNLALIQAIFGENSRALSTLTELLQTAYGRWLYYSMSITPALLD
jgi:non-specific serine/threonine protein kinase